MKSRNPFYNKIPRHQVIPDKRNEMLNNLASKEITCDDDCDYNDVINGECYCYNKEQDDGQPDWHQEWEDFGEVYSDKPNNI